MPPRATVLWLSRDESSCRTFSASPTAVRCAAATLVGLLVGAVLCFAWALWLSGQLARQQSDAAVLRGELQEKDAILHRRLTENRAYLRENTELRSEIEAVQGLEQRVRRFLGLSEAEIDGGASHQGGMGSAGFGGELDGPTAEAPGGPEFSALEVARTAAPNLQTRLREVVDLLEERREEAHRIPVRLPVSSPDLWVSCGFGWRSDPFSGSRREFHNGLDVAGPWRAPIVAPADGTVLKVARHRLLGNYVKIRHSDRIETIYGHLDSAAVKTGQEVRRGDVLGAMGNSGRSTGTHLHYSVSVDGKYVDPVDYIWQRPFGTLTL